MGARPRTVELFLFVAQEKQANKQVSSTYPNRWQALGGAEISMTRAALGFLPPHFPVSSKLSRLKQGTRTRPKAPLEARLARPRLVGRRSCFWNWKLQAIRPVQANLAWTHGESARKPPLREDTCANTDEGQLMWGCYVFQIVKSG